jgi:hypothetical protein
MATDDARRFNQDGQRQARRHADVVQWLRRSSGNMPLRNLVIGARHSGVGNHNFA